MPKEGSNYNCLGLMLIDFVIKKMKSNIHKNFYNVNTLKKKKDD